MKFCLLSIFILISALFSSCLLFMHNEPYEAVAIEGLDYCAFRHDCEYYKLSQCADGHYPIVIDDFLQSVIYYDDVIVAKCGIEREFFVRYYFMTYNQSDLDQYKVSGPISFSDCLDSLKNRNLDITKMKIVNFYKYDVSQTIHHAKKCIPLRTK